MADDSNVPDLCLPQGIYSFSRWQRGRDRFLRLSVFRTSVPLLLLFSCCLQYVWSSSFCPPSPLFLICSLQECSIFPSSVISFTCHLILESHLQVLLAAVELSIMHSLPQQMQLSWLWICERFHRWKEVHEKWKIKHLHFHDKSPRSATKRTLRWDCFISWGF